MTELSKQAESDIAKNNGVHKALVSLANGNKISWMFQQELENRGLVFIHTTYNKNSFPREQLHCQLSPRGIALIAELEKEV